MKKIEILSSGKEAVELHGAKFNDACADCACPGYSCNIECDGEHPWVDQLLDLARTLGKASISHPVD